MRTGVPIIVYLVVHVCAERNFEKCPVRCRCDFDQYGRKRTICIKGGMSSIPTQHMDFDVQVLVISSPSNNPNQLTLGRIFLEFKELEEIKITHSRIPAIGASSFWPGKKMKTLDLSHNDLTSLRDLDFNGLRNLRVLNLSDNNIKELPSATFRLLTSLETLVLARNKLISLVPRLFYLLNTLRHLDLSGNPLKSLDPENIKDVHPLKILNLADCQLSRLHSLVYQHLPNLEELDLRRNLFRIFAPEEFRHLKRLNVLHLAHNNLTVIMEKMFDGHKLRFLSLSHNQIGTFLPCAFCNASITELDLSSNHLKDVADNTFAPIINSLTSLDLSYNQIPPIILGSMLKPLYRLEKLSLVKMGFKTIEPDTFRTNTRLRHLDLSQNHLKNVTAQVIEPLKQLVSLDLSGNRLENLPFDFLKRLDNITSLDYVGLYSNPWSCRVCEIDDLYRWLNATHLFSEECKADERASACVTCIYPYYLEKRRLNSLPLSEIGLCYPADFQRQYLTVTTSHTGAIIAILVIVIFIAVIVVVVLVYRKQGADYYTGEERSGSDAFTERKNNKGPTYISTVEKIDDGIDIKHLSSRS